jgi:hypothetical protein
LEQSLLISKISQEVAQRTESSDSGNGTHFKLPKADVDDVCAVAARALSAILVVFPDGHPVRGVAMAELGKLLCVDVDESSVTQDTGFSTRESRVLQRNPTFPSGEGRLKLARDFLLRARTQLRKGFGGEGDEVGYEVEEQIRNVEKEWKAWKRVVSQGGLQAQQ